MNPPSTSSGSLFPSRTPQRGRQRDILPEEDGPITLEKTRMTTIFIGSMSERYTREIWKKDRDYVKTYYRGYGKFYHGTYNESRACINIVAKLVGKLCNKAAKRGVTDMPFRIVYAGDVKGNGSDDNCLIFQKGDPFSVRGLVNFFIRKVTKLELVILSHNSFVWADVLGLKLPPSKTLAIYYPQYLLPTNLVDTKDLVNKKTGTAALKTREGFFRATYNNLN